MIRAGLITQCKFSRVLYILAENKSKGNPQQPVLNDAAQLPNPGTACSPGAKARSPRQCPPTCLRGVSDNMASKMQEHQAHVAAKPVPSTLPADYPEHHGNLRPCANSPHRATLTFCFLLSQGIKTT
jgi:hypothetical protein